jgi:peptidoglycan LD-endopeptidase CwlK
MPSHQLTDLDPALQPLAAQFLALCTQKSLNVLVTCTWRSDEEQDALYAQGRTEPGKIVTDIAAGQGDKHNCSIAGKPAARAFDVVPLNNRRECIWDPNDPAWAQLGAIGKGLGLVWGGDWPHLQDRPHFELPD